MKDVEDHREFNGRNTVLAITVGLSPIWLLAFLSLASPACFGCGLPTEDVVIDSQRGALLATFALTGLLMVTGTVVLWRAQSTRAVVGAMCLLTLPALILVLLAPAFVLILWNATT